MNIVLYWTFLGLSAPYEVVERSCAIFCILIYFAWYKINMCGGIRWSLNRRPFSNRRPNGDFHWVSKGGLSTRPPKLDLVTWSVNLLIKGAVPVYRRRFGDHNRKTTQHPRRLVSIPNPTNHLATPTRLPTGWPSILHDRRELKT